MLYRCLGAADIASGVVALAVSVSAYQCYVAARDKRFLLVELGFLLMGLGLLMRGASLLLMSRRLAQVVVTCVMIQAVSRLVSYVMLAAAYTTQAVSHRGASVASVLGLLPSSPALDTVSIFLLAYIVFHVAMSFARSRSKLTLVVLLAFLLLAASHGLSLASRVALSLPLLILSYAAQVTSFALMLVTLLRVRAA
ncbi:MAG: hypothetical protein DRJ56_07035 [Thermoprotei archaeon]|nr:MAG: hypothetical protein DRJ56_07035 [Thermoprotei archaeon]